MLNVLNVIGKRMRVYLFILFALDLEGGGVEVVVVVDNFLEVFLVLSVVLIRFSFDLNMRWVEVDLIEVCRGIYLVLFGVEEVVDGSVFVVDIVLVVFVWLNGFGLEVNWDCGVVFEDFWIIVEDLFEWFFILVLLLLLDVEWIRVFFFFFMFRLVFMFWKGILIIIFVM